MAQTPCIKKKSEEVVDIAAGTARKAGVVVLLGTNLVTIAQVDADATETVAGAVEGTWTVPKDNSNVAVGNPLYWDATGNPVGGTAGSGAFTTTATSHPFAGFAVTAAGTTVGTVDMILRSVDSATVPGSFAAIPTATVAAAGSVIANAANVTSGFTLVTAADNAKGIALPASAAGQICVVKNAVATAKLLVYPAINSKINNAAANAVYNMGNAALRIFTCYNATDWFTDPETIV
jgi:predicted RecA/RadA family phage recombinase